MEISDRKDLDKLIAYSKSFRLGELEQDFEEQYTPPQFRIDEPPPIQEEEFNIALDDVSEDQLFQNLKNSILQQTQQQQVLSSECDIIDELTQEEQQQEQLQNDPVPQSMPVQDMTEYNKVSEEVLQFLESHKGRRSLFTETIKSRKGAPCGKPIKIYFFNTPQFVQLNVQKSTTVNQTIKMAIELQSKIQHNIVLDVEAYEIRIVDDDFEYKADMSFSALDRKKEILSTQTNIFALVNVPNYKPQQNQQLHQMIEQISQNSNMIVLDILIIEKQQNIASKIQLPKDSKASAILEKLSARVRKINARDYLVQVKGEDEMIDIDLKMPADQLLNKEIHVVKKQWADQAEESQLQQQVIQEIPTEEYSGEAPLNHIQAFKYEKFSVIKINERGKKQERLLGIDQFRIYNMNRKNSLNIFEKLLNNRETGTKYPERLIEDIVDMRIAGQNLFITFKQDNNEKERFKELKFDAIDAKIALKIYNKINFIRDFQQQNKQSRKTRTFSQRFE